MYSVVVVQEVLQSWWASWRWGAQWLVIESLQQPVESQHRSWSSSNYMRSCRRNQHWPFYSCSAFEENGEGEKAQYVGLGSSSQIKRIKKSSFGSVVFSFSVQQWTISQFDCDMWWNVDFMPNQWGPARWIKWEEAPKHSPKPHLHQQNVMITFGGPLLVWFAKIFWIPLKHLHLRSILHKWMRCSANCKQCSRHWSTEWAQVSMITPGHMLHNQCFQRWMNCASKFCLVCHIHLTPC